MAKTHSSYICQQCSYESPRWLGKCPNCNSWNSLVETVISTKSSRASSAVHATAAKPQKLSEIKISKSVRIPTKISELDRVLGGGLVGGQVVLLAGAPGIGKSTLLLQLANNLNKVLYAAGEESINQIAIRSQRLGIKNKDLEIIEETSVENIIATIEKSQKPSILIVDSIQTMTSDDLESAAGSISQVRESTAKLINMAKPKSIPVIIVGHITKEGAVAGPMTLEHMVDTVLNFEGDRYQGLRIVRTVKNRFGPTDEVGIFEMTDKGLELVSDPSKFIIEENEEKRLPGSCLSITMKGTRPILVEVQALVTNTPLPNARRVASGVDYNRLLTIIAILQQRLKLPLYKEDVYVNVTGGLEINEPAADLAIAIAILSSYKNLTLPPKTVAIGEVDLLGKIREVSFSDKRIKESLRLGFKNIITNKNMQNITSMRFSNNKTFPTI